MLAALSVSVHLFHKPTGSWTQCSLVNAELVRVDACQDPVPAACDVPWYLDSALRQTGNFVSWHATSPPLGYSQVTAEVDKDQSVGLRVGWAGGGGHFVAIIGYDYDPTGSTAIEDVDVADPSGGTISTIPFNTLLTAYRGVGAVSHVYFTKP